MPYRVRIRKFLNLQGFNAGAYILAEVEDSSASDDDRPYVDVNLTLADCSRSVSFDFDIGSAPARRNSLRKLNVMIDSLLEFREALVAEAELAKRRELQERRRSGRPSAGKRGSD
jgi:hypothetical protein